jgi:hypothetical protein
MENIFRCAREVPLGIFFESDCERPVFPAPHSFERNIIRGLTPPFVKNCTLCLISIAKQSFLVHCHPHHLRETLKIVFQLKLLSAPDNLRSFVSSPLLAWPRFADDTARPYAI